MYTEQDPSKSLEKKTHDVRLIVADSFDNSSIEVLQEDFESLHGYTIGVSEFRLILENLESSGKLRSSMDKSGKIVYSRIKKITPYNKIERSQADLDESKSSLQGLLKGDTTEHDARQYRKHFDKMFKY